jgi:hypothetical protein
LIELYIFRLNISEEDIILYRSMEEWDPASNDFVLRCIAARGEQISMSKLSVLHGKNIIVNSV